MSRFIIIGLFCLSGVVCLVITYFARQEGSRIPSLGDVSGFVMEYRVGRIPVGRIVVLGFWWWVGWHFFAR
jgi:hypothetical protein